MQRLSKRKMSYFQRLAAAIFLCMSVIGMLMTLFLYLLFSASMEHELIRVNNAMLMLTEKQARILYDQVTALGEGFLTDGEMMQFMLSDTKDPLLEANLMRKLNATYLSSANIDSILVYNGMQNRYLNSRGIQYPPDEGIIDMINETDNDPVRARITRIVPRTYEELDMYGEPRDKRHHVLTYIVYPSLLQLPPAKYAIAINVRADSLMESIMESMDRLTGTSTIIDANGHAIVSSTLAGFCEDLSDRGYVQTILAADTGSGSFSASVDGVNSLVSYVRSQKTQGWTFIDVIPRDVLYPGLTALRNAMALVLFGLILLSAALTAVLTRRLYRPVKRLVQSVAPDRAQRGLQDEFMMIESSYHDAQYMMRQMGKRLDRSARRSCLKALLEGGDLNDPSIQAALSELSERGGYYFAAAARVRGNGEALQAANGFLSSVLNDLAWYQVEPMDDGTLGLLVCYLDTPDPGAVDQCFEECDAILRDHFDSSCTAGLGEAVSQLDELSESYAQAREALGYAYLLEGEVVIRYEQIEAQSRACYVYPIQQEKRLLEAMRTQDRDRAFALLDELIDALRQASSQTAHLIPSQLMLSLLRDCVHPDDAAEIQGLIMDLGHCEALSHVSAAMKHIAARILDRNAARKATSGQRLADQVKSLIMENMGDSGYDVNQAALALGMSTAYLGRRFKAEAGLSFREFLLQTRLSRAVDLLKHTDKTVVDISCEVGIPNANYFFLLFKKAHGMTPSEYRKQHI